jgi:hypothetical protein
VGEQKHGISPIIGHHRSPDLATALASSLYSTETTIPTTATMATKFEDIAKGPKGE